MNGADTPAGAIARLDSSLQRRGKNVTIKRGATSITARAKVRAVRAEDLIGSATVSHYTVVMSPTGLSSIGLPMKTDAVVIQGRGMKVLFVDNIHMDDVWVRSKLTVAG